MDLRQFREVVRRSWILIAASAAVFALLAFLVAYFKAEYQVVARVLVRPVDSGVATGTRPRVGLISPTTLPILQTARDSYIHLLKSRGVAERIVQRLHEEGTPTAPAPVPAWRQALRTMVQKVQDGIRVILYLRWPFEDLDPRDREVLDVKESINGNVLANSTVFEISAVHRRPEVASTLAKLAAEVFVQFTQEFNASKAVTTRKFLDEQVGGAQADLRAAQARMHEFRRVHGIFLSIDDEGKQRVAELLTLESVTRTVETERRQSQSRIQETLHKLEGHPQTVRTSATTDVNPLVRDLRTQVITLESRLPSLLVDFQPTHPQVVALRQQIATLKNQLQSEVGRLLTAEVQGLNPVHQTLLTNLVGEQINLEGLDARKAGLDALLSRVRSELSALSENKNTWDRLIGDIKSQTDRLGKLQGDLDSARLSEATKLEEIQIIDAGVPAQFPTWKGLPLLFFPLAGLVIGALGASGLAVALDRLDPSIKDPEALRVRLNLPLYGVVEKAVPWDGVAPASEAGLVPTSYRYVRTRLLGASVAGKPLRGLVMTALTAEEEPGAVAASLAAAYAQIGTRTLLADCRASGGSPDRLRGLRSVHNLDILSDGDRQFPSADDPSRVEKILGLVRAQRSADHVVIFLAPALDTSLDAVRLACAPEADSLLLVVWHRRTKLEVCQEAKSRLDEMGVRHVGLLYVR